MARLLLAVVLATALLLPTSAGAHGRRPRHPHASSTTHRHASARRVAPEEPAGPDPVVLATAVAERFWGAVPCGGQITVLPYSPRGPRSEPLDRRLGHVQLLARAERPASAGRHLHAMHDLSRRLAVADAGGRGRRLEHVLPDGDPRDGTPARPSPLAPSGQCHGACVHRRIERSVDLPDDAADPAPVGRGDNDAALRPAPCARRPAPCASRPACRQLRRSTRLALYRGGGARSWTAERWPCPRR